MARKASPGREFAKILVLRFERLMLNPSVEVSFFFVPSGIESRLSAAFHSGTPWSPSSRSYQIG